MKAFEWANASDVDEAVKLLSDATDPKGDPDDAPRPMGGGQDLLTTMKNYISRPPRVVNLKTIAGMNGITVADDGSATIGALATLSEVEEHPAIKAKFPGLAEAAHSVATPQIRHRGTVGGNLCQRPRCWYYRLESVKCFKKGGDNCYASDGENKYHAIFGGGPSYIVHPSDLATILVALNASVSIAGPKGSRDIALNRFFALPRDIIRRENVLRDDEIVTAVHIPASTIGARSTYLKFKERQSLDFAMAAVAAGVDLNADKTVKSVRLVLGGVAPIPWHVPAAEKYLVGKTLDDKTVAQAAQIALDGAEPLEKNGYKIPLTQTLVRRALLKLNA